MGLRRISLTFRKVNHGENFCCLFHVTLCHFDHMVRSVAQLEAFLASVAIYRPLPRPRVGQGEIVDRGQGLDKIDFAATSFASDAAKSCAALP